LQLCLIHKEEKKKERNNKNLEKIEGLTDKVNDKKEIIKMVGGNNKELEKWVLLLKIVKEFKKENMRRKNMRIYA